MSTVRGHLDTLILILRDYAALVGDDHDPGGICNCDIKAELAWLEEHGDSLAEPIKVPEASGADYVRVPREPTVEMLDAMNRVQERHNGRIYAAALSAVANPAPPTSGEGVLAIVRDGPPYSNAEFAAIVSAANPTPADESGAVRVDLGLDQVSMAYSEWKAPTAEPRAAAQEPEWLAALRKEVTLFAPMKSSFTLSRDELAHLFDRLQPSGAAASAPPGAPSSAGDQ